MTTFVPGDHQVHSFARVKDADRVGWLGRLDGVATIDLNERQLGVGDGKRDAGERAIVGLADQ